MTLSSRKVLLVAPSWVGDMIMSHSLIQLIRARYGSLCVIDVLAPNFALDLYKRMPEVRQVWSNPFGHGELNLARRFSLGLKFRAEHYTQVFVLPNSFKSALIPFFARIKQRTGMLGEMRYLLLNDYLNLDKVRWPRMVDRFCALLNSTNQTNQAHAIPQPQLAVDKVQQSATLARLNLQLNQPVVCLCPGAEYGPAKRWPSAYFAEVAGTLQQRGYQVWIMGGENDQGVASAIVEQASLRSWLIDLSGRTRLSEVLDLLACSSLVISNDSGLMHLACAVAVPVIAIYGSSSPDFTPPLSTEANIIKVDLECAPCFQRTCRYGHYNCLQQITPDAILRRVETMGLC